MKIWFWSGLLWYDWLRRLVQFRTGPKPDGIKHSRTHHRHRAVHAPDQQHFIPSVIVPVHVELTRIDPVHDVPGLSLAAARGLQRVPQSVTICDRNLTRGQSSALTLGSSLTSPTGVQKIFACTRCCHAIPERTRAVRPFRSSVHSCQSSLLRHQNGDQNRMTRYPLHVDALYIALTHTNHIYMYT